jgi:folate-binding protein YgfZ
VIPERLVSQALTALTASTAATGSTAVSEAEIERLAAAIGGAALPAADSPGYGPQLAFGREDRLWRSGVMPLLEYGLLKVHGAEAASFLQAQFTSDVAGLVGTDGVRLAGYCSIKGRLTASFWVWRDESEQAFWLACSRDIAAATARRLAMFVLRAKVKLEDLSATMALVGALSVPEEPLAAAHMGPVRLPAVEVDPATLAALAAPASGDGAAEPGRARLRIERTMQVVALASLPQLLGQSRNDGVALLPTAAWRRLEVLSGIARINAANQDLFVPQMVNFELVDGVNFKKGCYPGQEVVARSQYLGKLKRRMFLALGDGKAPAPGVDVVAADPAGERAAEPVGQVVLAAPLPGDTRFIGLFESRTAALPAQGPAPVATGLQVGGSSLRRLPLPYTVPVADAPKAL